MALIEVLAGLTLGALRHKRQLIQATVWQSDSDFRRNTFLEFDRNVVVPAGASGDFVAKAVLKLFVNQVDSSGTLKVRLNHPQLPELSLTVRDLCVPKK